MDTQLLNITSDYATDYLSYLNRSNGKYLIFQDNGQRIIGPPKDWDETKDLPEKDSEVFIGKIPRDCTEQDLLPIFELVGRIYQMRLMFDFNGNNRGYGFVQYFCRADAQQAVTLLNNRLLRPKWSIGVMPSKNNNRLFFGNLPNNINRNMLYNEVRTLTPGIKSCVYYGGSHRSNGFAFVEYENHKLTALARRKFYYGNALLQFMRI